jgi:hypothetical protein
LAESLRIDHATVRGWEAGHHQHIRESLHVIARVLEIR